MRLYLVLLYLLILLPTSFMLSVLLFIIRDGSITLIEPNLAILYGHTTLWGLSSLFALGNLVILLWRWLHDHWK